MLDYDENQDYENIENAVLGAIILESWAFDVVSADLKPHCFDNPANADIYQAICDLKASRVNPDLYTIAVQLKKIGKLESVGGSTYVSSLTEKIASSANIEHHAKIILQRYLERKLREIGHYAIVKSHDKSADVFDSYEEISSKLGGLLEEVTTNKGFDTIAKIGEAFVQNLNDIKSGVVEQALPYGLIEVDKYGGRYKSDLIYIGARPGMGKTAFIVKMIRTVVLGMGKPVGVFSLEMSSLQLMRRIVSAELQINGEDLRTGNVTHAQINEINEKIKKDWSDKPLYIDDKSCDIDMLCIKARQMKKLFNIEELIIDYLGFITARRFEHNKNAEVTYISKRLKMLAKELDIPITCLAQLSRNIEERKLEERMPRLSDLRDSGSIEQDADQVLFLFRPDYYNVDKYFVKGTEIYTKGRCFVIIAKNRHGVTETKLVGFNGAFTEFYDLPESLPSSQLTIDTMATPPKDFSQPTQKIEDSDLPF